MITKHGGGTIATASRAVIRPSTFITAEVRCQIPANNSRFPEHSGNVALLVAGTFQESMFGCPTVWQEFNICIFFFLHK